MAPLIFIVPGFWEGPEVFDNLSSELTSAGYGNVYVVKLKSTGTWSPGNPSMDSDIARIRQKLEPFVEKGNEIIMVLHSAGGFLGSNAFEGLSEKARKNEGLAGGVKGIVFVSAAIYPEGFHHGDLPFAMVDGPILRPLDSVGLLFNDLPASDAVVKSSELFTQPAQDWNSTITWCGWREVPSAYISCSKDTAIPLLIQYEMAKAAGCEVVEMDTGHMPHVSKPKELADMIISVSQKLIDSGASKA